MAPAPRGRPRGGGNVASPIQGPRAAGSAPAKANQRRWAPARVPRRSTAWWRSPPGQGQATAASVDGCGDRGGGRRGDRSPSGVDHLRRASRAGCAMGSACLVWCRAPECEPGSRHPTGAPREVKPPEMGPAADRRRPKRRAHGSNHRSRASWVRSLAVVWAPSAAAPHQAASPVVATLGQREAGPRA